MHGRIIAAFMLMMAASLSIGCTPEAVPAATPDAKRGEGEALVLGDISDEAAETIAGTQPLADYLAARLMEQGIARGRVRIAPDLSTMVRLVESGEVDVYFDSPYPVLIVSRKTGAKPILRRQKYGVAEYHSVFFTRADAGLAELADLPGQMVAFEEAFSTSGYMLPLAHLLEAGMNPVEKSSPVVPVADDEVGYVFSTADNTTIQWVISGRVPVGVIDNVTFSRLPADTRSKLVIIGRTEAVPRQMVLVRPGLDPALVEAITNELLAMDESADGQAVLDIFLTSEFDEFPQGATTALERMEAFYELAQTR